MKKLTACIVLALSSNLYANDAMYKPIPQSVDLPANKVALGSKLFHEKRMSADNTISCASCHALDKGGTDNLPKSPGIKGQLGKRNSPTVLNSAYNFKQFWDGRSPDLKDQVNGPTHAPDEMGSNWDEIIAKLSKDEAYTKEFKAVYNDTVKPEHIRDAIATFETSLITPDSPFDQYLRGDKTAMSKEAMAGYALFNNKGCVACHNGINIGGALFQRFGIYGDYYEDNKLDHGGDFGLYNITKKDADKFVFKVPTLRNVELTYPYLHDGSVKTLDEAVQVMAKYQLNQKLSKEEVGQIVTFLKALTGKQPKR
jgi:cytochrome c peroxidase